MFNFFKKTDMLQHKRNEVKILPIKSIMTTDVIYVHPETPIFEAMQTLKRCQISGMPVVDSEMRLVGILSEKDVLQILLDPHHKITETVATFMSRNVVSFKEDDSAIEVCQFFLKNPIRRVPIVRDDKVIGILSRRDIIAYILEAKENMADYRFS